MLMKHQRAIALLLCCCFALWPIGGLAELPSDAILPDPIRVDESSVYDEFVPEEAKGESIVLTAVAPVVSFASLDEAQTPLVERAIYRVTFFDWYGQELGYYDVPEGEGIEEPEITLEEPGYAFRFWFDELDEEIVPYAFGMPVLRNINLIPYYEYIAIDPSQEELVWDASASDDALTLKAPVLTDRQVSNLIQQIIQSSSPASLTVEEDNTVYLMPEMPTPEETSIEHIAQQIIDPMDPINRMQNMIEPGSPVYPPTASPQGTDAPRTIENIAQDIIATGAPERTDAPVTEGTIQRPTVAPARPTPEPEVEQLPQDDVEPVRPDPTETAEPMETPQPTPVPTETPQTTEEPQGTVIPLVTPMPTLEPIELPEVPMPTQVATPAPTATPSPMPTWSPTITSESPKTTMTDDQINQLIYDILGGAEQAQEPEPADTGIEPDSRAELEIETPGQTEPPAETTAEPLPTEAPELTQPPEQDTLLTVDSDETPEELEGASSIRPQVIIDYYPELDLITSGTIITVVATVTNVPEDVPIQYQWQNDASGTYKDVPGATDRSYSYIVDTYGEGCNWRVTVTIG